MVAVLLATACVTPGGLQMAAGVFKWGKALEKALKMTKMEVEKQSKSHKGEDVWVTALAVTFLQVKMSGSKDMWELVVDKAVAFLEGKLGVAKAAEVLKVAEERVKSLIFFCTLPLFEKL